MDFDEFESLNPDQQEQVFHKSSFRDKADLILHSHNPDALTRSLSSEELYLLTREMDVDERSEVIRYATLPQLFFVGDIDCWKKDRIDGRGFLRWLEVLLNAGEEQLLRWLQEVDYETVITGFQHLIEVIKPDHEWAADEVLGDRPYFSLDQMYYICVSEENIETIKRVLEVLFENTRGRYFAILEGVLGEMYDELEEEAYRRREMRLGERGFPDNETAHMIYRPMSRQEYENFPLKKVSTQEVRDTEISLPNYIVMWSQERFFLDDVLHAFQNDTTGTRDKLQEELAWISNKVIACEGIDLSSEVKVRRGIERARYFINIGLESLSGGDLLKAKKILEERWLEIIFRWGATQVLQLKDHASKIVKEYWDGSQVNFFNFLNAPYDVIMIGLFRFLPQTYDALVPGAEPLRDFKTLQDLERSRQSSCQVEKLHECLAKFLKKNLEEAKKIPGMTLYQLFGTLYAGFSFSHKIQLAPLSSTEFSKWLQSCFREGHFSGWEPELEESFFQTFSEEKDRELLRPFFLLFFDHLKTELKAVRDFRKLDPSGFFAVWVQSETLKAKSRRPKKKPV